MESRARSCHPRRRAKRREAATGGHAGNAHHTEGCRDTQAKPRSHDTSRIAWAKLMARGGGRVSARVPELWRRHPADRLHHGAGADPEDPHPLGRTARTAADLSCPRPAHRLGRACCTNFRERGCFGGFRRASQSSGRKIRPREEADYLPCFPRDLGEKRKAGEGTRTLDIQLGKLALYQLSYARGRPRV
jgi:hypothetical protein